METETCPQDNRRRERERCPLPTLELERRHHGDQEERHGERERNQEAQPQRLYRIGPRAGISGRPGRVTGRLDGSHQARELDLSRVVRDGRELGRVIHIRLDPVELVQLLLDASGAGRARHAADLKLEPAGSVDRHQAAS
jgi:hypothetical protein